MDLISYAIWAAVLLLAVSGTVTVLRSRTWQIKSSYVTLLFWWAAIALAATGFSVYHLVWLMPVAFLVPVLILFHAVQYSFQPSSIGGLMLKSLVVFGPALAVAFRFA